MISEQDILNASILVVDDQETNTLLLTQVLANAGYTAVSATNDPQQVCDLYRENNYDLIVLDFQMPDIDGFQVMTKLKEIETDSYLPVLAIIGEPAHGVMGAEGRVDRIGQPVGCWLIACR